MWCFPSVVLLASFCKGIYHSCSSFGYEAFRKNKEIFSVPLSSKSPHKSCLGHYFCENIPSIFYFCGQGHTSRPPKISAPKSFGYAKALISTALLITGVVILESVGMAKALVAKNGYQLDSNQDLFGLGVANIYGSLFLAYPTIGSLFLGRL